MKKRRIINNKSIDNRIQLTVLGGGQEIGANSYLIKWGNKNILIDAGQNPQKELSDALVPIHRIPKKLDAMIISHAHLDHIGSIPFIFQKRSPSKIISQEYSRPIITRMIMNTAVFLKKFARESQEYEYSKSYYWNKIGILEKEMKKNAYPYHEKFSVSDKITGYFFDAGHILGSSGIVLTDGDYTLIYTGDIALHSHGIHNGAKLPNIKNVNCLMIESTTASETVHVEEREQWKNLFNWINDAYRRKSRVLIPTFALGRSQDVVSLIAYGKLKGEIDENIHVFLGGLGIAISEIYEEFPTKLRKKLYSKSLFQMFETISYDELKPTYLEYLNNNETAIFILTNGMMAKGTPSSIIGKMMVENPNETIIFSGYQATSTLGYEVLNAKENDIVDFGEHEVESINIKSPHRYQIRLSGHGSRQEMNDIISHFKPTNVAIIHGDKSSVNNLVEDVKHQNRVVIGPKTGESLLLRTENNKIMRSKSDIKAHIITVGTSLIGNYIRKTAKKNPQHIDLVDIIVETQGNRNAMSAEIQTMMGIDISKDDQLYFISSGDKQGQLSGNALADAYEHLGYSTKNIVINNLTKDFKQFQNFGLPEFIHTIVDLIEDHSKNINIIATGGFKAETAFATLVGALMKVPVHYIHEDFQTVIEMPGLPIGIDFSIWTTYFNTVEIILMQSNLKYAQHIIDNQLPPFLGILFKKDYDLQQMVLTPIGELINRLHSEYILLQENIMILNCGLNHKHIWGSGRVNINHLPNQELRIILNRFQLHSSFIREMRIGKEIEITSKNVIVKFHHIESKKVFYHILTQNGGQEIIVHTYVGVEKEFVNRIGKTITI